MLLKGLLRNSEEPHRSSKYLTAFGTKNIEAKVTCNTRMKMLRTISVLPRFERFFEYGSSSDAVRMTNPNAIPKGGRMIAINKNT